MILWVKFKNLLKNNPFWISMPVVAALLVAFSPLGLAAICFTSFGVGFATNLLILRFTQPRLQGAAWELEKARLEKEALLLGDENTFLKEEKTLKYDAALSNANGFTSYTLQ